MTREEIKQQFKKTNSTTGDFCDWSKFTHGVEFTQSSVSRQLNEKQIKNINPAYLLCFKLFFDYRRRLGGET